MVGDGEMAADIRRRAGPNITIKNRLNFDELRKAYAQSRALVFTAEEDFGIIPVEAMASGRPVLAYNSGGVRDSVTDDESGILFDVQTPDSLIEGVERLEAWLPSFDPAVAIRQAQRFAPERFDEGIMKAVAL